MRDAITLPLSAEQDKAAQEAWSAEGQQTGAIFGQVHSYHHTLKFCIYTPSEAHQIKRCLERINAQRRKAVTA